MKTSGPRSFIRGKDLLPSLFSLSLGHDGQVDPPQMDFIVRESGLRLEVKCSVGNVHPAMFIA
ncbi:MAG: hypothetical protein ABSE44_06480 [Candidatus Sulfotelmatobacter sp.]|jgi:hypothetical protein